MSYTIGRKLLVVGRENIPLPTNKDDIKKYDRYGSGFYEINGSTKTPLGLWKKSPEQAALDLKKDIELKGDIVNYIEVMDNGDFVVQAEVRGGLLGAIILSCFILAILVGAYYVISSIQKLFTVSIPGLGEISLLPIILLLVGGILIYKLASRVPALPEYYPEEEYEYEYVEV